eukprot:scaffold72788_cov19-Tisochrysis_lutea.AAC.1
MPCIFAPAILQSVSSCPANHSSQEAASTYSDKAAAVVPGLFLFQILRQIGCCMACRVDDEDTEDEDEDQRRAGVLMQQLCIALEQLRILKNFIT